MVGRTSEVLGVIHLGGVFHPAQPHTHHIHLPVGCILAILSYAKCDRSCRSTQMARPTPTDQATSKILPLLNGIDADRLSIAEGRGQSHVETPSSTITRWHNTDFGSDTQAEAQRRTQKFHKRILCLDGGGIRGISILLILQSIMENIRDIRGLPETPRPCDYFSLIGGTRTGGIIAIMLGPLRMTVAQCLKAYKDMAKRAFTQINSGFLGWLPQLPARQSGSFSGTCLEEAIKDIVEDYKGDKEALFADEGCCKTVVLAITKTDVGATPAKFKTYNIGEGFRGCRIWEVPRATSAAVTFFPSISCGEQEIEFIDAGFGHNNPTEVLLGEAQDIFLDEICGCIISIGAGLSGVITIEDKRLSILDTLKKMANNSEAVHRRLAKRLPEDVYFRFNVNKGLDDNTLLDWEKLSKISAHTANYLAEVDVGRAINRCARILTRAFNSEPQKSSHLFRRRIRFNDSTMLSEEDMRQQYYIAWAYRLQQNLPPQVLLSDPVVLCDAFDKFFAFFLEWVASAEVFVTIMEERTRSTLEEKCKIQGSAKIRKREFILQDLKAKRRFNLQQHAWSIIMRPGKTRYMSITFRETGAIKTSCPHCGTENATNEDELVMCEICEVIYERIIELEDEDEDSGSLFGNESHLVGYIESKKRKRDPANEIDLKRAFRRLTLTSKAPWLDLKEPVYTFKRSQDVEVEVDMDDSSSFGDEEIDSVDSGSTHSDVLMTFEWDNSQDIKAPDNTAIEAPNSTDAVLPPAQNVQRTHYTPERPGGPIRTLKIWTCHECGDSGMTRFHDFCSSCGHNFCQNCETYEPWPR